MMSALASGLASVAVAAESPAEWYADRLWAGEIIMVPQQDTGKPAGKARSATEQRDRARAYQEDDASAVPSIIVVPEEEVEGALFPRGGATEGRARDNRSRAADYQHGNDSSYRPLIKPNSGSLTDGVTTQDKAHENRARAGGYSRGDGQAGFTGRVGPDGIPFVICKDRDNVAGQIGDGLQSGSVIVILRDGKQVKVRCQ